MKAIKTLEDMLVKTANNTSKKNRKTAVDALIVLLMENNDPQQVIEYLLKFHYSVCQSFFEELCTAASDEQVALVVEMLLGNEQFVKVKTLYPKGFAAVFALASKEKHQSAFLVLIKILSVAEKTDGFSDGCVNNCKRLIVDNNGWPFIANLSDEIGKGSVVCKESEQQRLNRFLKIIANMIANTEKKDTSAVSKDISLRKNSTATGYSDNIDFLPKPATTAISDNMEIVLKFEKTQQEVLNHVRILVENWTSIDNHLGSLTQKDRELKLLYETITDKEHNIVLITDELATTNKQLLATRGQVDDLTKRLSTSLQMDNISKSQELITLKNDISEALKLDYVDFAKSKNNEYGEDLFEAYRSMLTRIFKLLKRFGITCQ